MHPVPPVAGGFAWRALLTALLLAVCVTDVRARRIPNALVLVVLGAALAHASVASVTGAPTPGLAAGPVAAVLGALAGLALWLPLYAAGAFGAGDVKLFAAAAAWLGPAGVPNATLYAAVSGGVLGISWLLAPRVTALAQAVAPRIARGLGGDRTDRPRVPYGVAIAAGVLGALWGAP